jgi:CheY-like chemotaxis protein
MLALIADRDSNSRTMYAEYLRLAARPAYQIEESDDGRDALVKVMALRPDVVIAETGLPGINGYELCRLLRDDAETRATPIVMVTADALKDDVQRAERAGADVVLVKPCLPETVHREIQRLLRLSSELRERSRSARERLQHQIARSDALIGRSRTRRTMLNSAHERHQTTDPPLAPPALICPSCDRPLRYLRSHVGGVTARNSEQWDYFECGTCGTFQYRQRTRKMRQV